MTRSSAVADSILRFYVCFYGSDSLISIEICQLAGEVALSFQWSSARWWLHFQAKEEGENATYHRIERTRAFRETDQIISLCRETYRGQLLSWWWADPVGSFGRLHVPRARGQHRCVFQFFSCLHQHRDTFGSFLLDHQMNPDPKYSRMYSKQCRFECDSVIVEHGCNLSCFVFLAALFCIWSLRIFVLFMREVFGLEGRSYWFAWGEV